MKNAWTTPELVVHGAVQELTERRSKSLGKSDGVILIGIPGVPDGTTVGS